MELLTTTILKLKHQQFTSTNSNLTLFDEFLNNIYNLQIEQLHDIAQIASKQYKLNKYIPELPKKSDIALLKSVIQSNKDEDEDDDDEDEDEEDEKEEEEAKGGDDNKNNKKKKSKKDEEKEEKYQIRVLSFMLNSLSQNDNKKQIELFCSDKSLNALLKLSFESSSPRTRNVCLRLLRQLLLNEDLIKIDKKVFVNKVLLNIGQSLLSPVIASYFINDQGSNIEFIEYLSSLRLQNYIQLMDVP